MARPDANKIALQAVRQLLDAEVPQSLTVAGHEVAITAHRGGAARFIDGIEGLDPERDGPWPEPLFIDCDWGKGRVRLQLSADRFQWSGGPERRRSVALAVHVNKSWQELIWITVGFTVWDKADGDAGRLLGSVSLSTRRGEDYGHVAALSAQLQRLAATDGLTFVGKQVSLGSIRVPTAEIEPTAHAVLSAVLHAALLKLPFLTRNDPDAIEGEHLVTTLPATDEASTGVTAISDDSPEPAQRRKAIWPLPGGVREQLKTLKAMVEWLSRGEFPDEELNEFLDHTYDARGVVSVGGYKQVLRTLDFADFSAGMWSLTEAGRAWLEDPQPAVVFEHFHATTTGIIETLVIVSARGPIDADGTAALLNPLLGATWKTATQVIFRRNWLLSLGLTERTSGADLVTDAGRAVLAAHASEVEAVQARLPARAPTAVLEPDDLGEDDGAIEPPELPVAATRVDLQPERVAKLLDKKLYLPDGVLEMACAALSSGHHLLLIGPPGTGKTELAKILAEAARADELCKGARMTTASADWTTYDTIGGYAVEPKDGTTSLRFRSGVFLQALENQEWLIIDELNRADVDRAFGELMTVLSGKGVSTSYRQPDKRTVAIGFVGEPPPPGGWTHVVPATFRVIASMNTWDKTSLFKLSYALQRRFAIVYVGAPAADKYEKLLRDAAARPGFEPELGAESTQSLVKLFRDDAVLGLKEVGPAIGLDMVRYLRQRNHSEDGLAEALAMYLLPQLEGLERAQIAKAREILREAAGSTASKRARDLLDGRMTDLLGKEGARA